MHLHAILTSTKSYQFYLQNISRVQPCFTSSTATILDHATITSCLEKCNGLWRGSLCFFLWIPNTIAIGILGKFISQIISLFCWEVSNNPLRLKSQRFYNGLQAPLKCSSLLTLISCHLTGPMFPPCWDSVPPQTWQVCFTSEFLHLLSSWPGMLCPHIAMWLSPSSFYV